MKNHQRIGLFLAVSVVAVGGLIYELMIGTVSSYLLGNSILHFSVTIGIFLSGMGIGSFAAGYLKRDAVKLFIVVESLLGIIGGNCVVLLFALFTYAFSLFYLGLGVLVLSIGALIGLEIPLLLRMLQGFTHTHRVVTRVLSLDYLGSLVASIVFPLLLLPWLGLLRTSLLVGLMNLTVAGLIHFFFHKETLRKYSLASVLLVMCWFGLIAENIGAHYIADYFDHKLYKDEVVLSQQSPYQKIVITKFKDDVRLFLDANLQFSSKDEYRYHESLVHIPVSFLPSSHPQNVLILGGGDGLAAREVQKYLSVSKITLVDLDKEMTQLATSHHLLTTLNERSLSKGVEIVNQDAMNFLEANSHSYDLILIDLPDPNHESLAKLYTREFYQLVAHHLSADGVMVTQATSPFFTNKSFWTIHDTIAESGLYAKPFHLNVPSFGEWGFVMGAKYELFNKPPRPLRVTTRFLNDESVQAEFIFDKDVAKKSSTLEISTLFNPTILEAYQEETKEWQE